MPAETGADVRVYYLWEDNGFASAPTDATHKAFGANASLRTAEGSNEAQEVLQPGSKIPADVIEQTFDGRWSVEFTLTNAWWLGFIFGDPSSTDNGDGSHTHSYTGTAVNTGRIFEGYEGSSVERVLEGCVLSSATVDSRVDDNVTVTLEGPYASELEDTSGIQTQPSLDYRTMTFAQASVSLSGTAKTLVQNASLDIPLQAQLVKELGSRFAVDYFTTSRVPRVTISERRQSGNTDSLEDFYGGATDPGETITNEKPMTFTFDNGKAAGSGINKLVVDITGSIMDSFSEDGIGDPDSPIEERINRVAEDVTGDYTNETSTAP